MKLLLIPFVLFLSLTVASTAFAGEYQCKGDSVVKGGSTKFKIRRSGADFAVEKGGSTKGRVKQQGQKLVVTVSGSTKATIADGKIRKGGSSWGTVAEAQRQFDCGGDVAAALWVLFKIGKLP